MNWLLFSQIKVGDYFTANGKQYMKVRIDDFIVSAVDMGTGWLKNFHHTDKVGSNHVQSQMGE